MDKKPVRKYPGVQLFQNLQRPGNLHTRKKFTTLENLQKTTKTLCPHVENLRTKTSRDTENQKRTRHVTKNSKKNGHPRRKFATLENLPKSAKNLRPHKKNLPKKWTNLEEITERKPEKLTKSGKTYDTMEKLTEKIDKSRKIYRKKA